MNRTTFVTSFACVVVSVGLSRPALAERSATRPGPNRIGLGGGVGISYLQAGSDGHLTDGYPRGGLRGSYAYRAVRHLEVGGLLDVLPASHYTVGSILVPAGSVRGYVPFGARDSIELGFRLELGLFALTSSRHTWVGPNFAGGPDVRVWLNRVVAVELMAEGVFAEGQPTGGLPDSYVSNAVFLKVGGVFSLLWRF